MRIAEGTAGGYLEQQVTAAELDWRAAQSDYRSLEVELAGELLDREADLAGVEASWKSAELQTEANGRPDALKAELRIAETQTKDVAVGQAAMIDTRNVVLPGHVSRIDPAVQQGSVLAGSRCSTWRSSTGSAKATG